MDINNLWSGYDLNSKKQNTRCLAVNTILEGKYLVGPVIGQGGFGITYVGFDLNMESKIAIKEYFPVELVSRDTTTMHGDRVLSLSGEKSVTYKQGLNKYVAEAQNVSQFSEIPGVVSVKDFFYANETAYIVMEFIDGISLKDYLKEKGGRLTEEETLKIMKPVLEALVQVHKSGIIHRDISPDNIMLTFKDGNTHTQIESVKLIDFGAARMTAKNDQKSLTIILKHGYAPEEQYRTHGEQGSWTDVYALCAVLYRMLTGETPVPAMDRMFQDELKNFDKFNTKVSENTVAAILKGLAVKKDDRIQNVQELIEALYEGAKIKDASRKSGKNKWGVYAGIGAAAVAACAIGFAVLSRGEKTASNIFGTVVNGTQSAEGEILMDTTVQEDETGEQITFYHPQRSVANSWENLLMCLPDGSVQAFGNNDSGQCNVEDWENVVRVECIGSGSIGVRKDGTILFAGAEHLGQNLELWTDVVDVQAVNFGIAGLTKDGTILISTSYGVLNEEQAALAETLQEWNDIKAITSRFSFVFGLKQDGTVIGIDEEMNHYEFTGWEDVECLDIADSYCGSALIGICSDGTIKTHSLTEYGYSMIYADILAKFAEGKNVAQIQDDVMVTQEGTVLMIDDRDQRKETAEKLATWSDMVAVSSNTDSPDAFYYGVKSDGTIVNSMISRGNAELEEFKNLEWVEIVTDMNRVFESVVGYTKDHKLLVYTISDNAYELMATFAEDAYHLRERMMFESQYDRSVAWYQDPEIYQFLCEEASKIKDYDSKRDMLTSVLVQEDGTAAFYSGMREPVLFENVKGIANNNDNLILKKNGTVEIVDHGVEDRLDEQERYAYVKEWTDVEQIIDCQNVVFGLKADGTLITISDYMETEYPVMKKLVSSSFLALGITKDDGVYVVLSDGTCREKGMDQVDSWTNVANLAIGDSHTVALLHDGTVRATGSNSRGQCDVEEWTNVEKIYAGEACTLGIDQDGNLLIAGALN